MIKPVKRSKNLSASKGCLAYRVGYIADQDHPDHGGKGKLVLPSRNYGCGGQTVKEYLMAVAEAHALGKIRNEKRKVGNKSGGNPTKDLFLEFIYSSPEGSYPTAEERELIEAILIAEFQGCAIRTAWHINPANGICDLHLLVAARDRYGNATMNRFGDGKQTFVSRRDQLNQEICDILNSNREVVFEPVHVIHLKNKGERVGTKLTKLWEMIANATKKIVTRDNLAEIIEGLGHKVTNAATLLEDKVANVIFKGRVTERPHRIDKLLLQIAECQLDIELARPEGNEGEEGGAGGESGGGTGLDKTTKKTEDVAPVAPPVKTAPIVRPAPPAKKAAKKKIRKPLSPPEREI